MSRSPYFYLEVFNTELGKYIRVAPIIWNYKHTEMIPADLFPYNGCHDVFEILEESPYWCDGKDEFHMCGIHEGLPLDVSDGIREEYESVKDEIIADNKRVRWITYADLLIHCLKYPKVDDYDNIREDEDGNEIVEKKDHPLFTLKHRVDAFMDVWDDFGWENNYSLIRIVYWIF